MSFYNRVRVWASEVLFSSDLNAEFNAVQQSVNSITQEQLSPLSVGSDQLQNSAVKTGHIGANAVTFLKLAAGAVTASEHVKTSTGVDLDYNVWKEVATQNLDVASPPGKVLCLFTCMFEVGDNGAVIGNNPVIVTLRRDTIALTSWTVDLRFQDQGLSQYHQPFSFAHIDAGATAGSGHAYSVECKSGATNFSERTTNVPEAALTLVEFRR